MASVVENKRKSRKVLRGSFTRVAHDLEDLLQADIRDNELTEVTWELLNSKFEELRALDNELTELSLESATEEELDSDMNTCDVYIKKFTVLKIKYNKLLEEPVAVESVSHRAASDTGTEASDIGENTGMRKFKLPRIEFKHYDGSIKDWLSFWAQFKKVHEDQHIDNHDKIEYLRQATISGSRARQLVDSYPAMSENYEKIVESMKSRFGREDLQIEVYVRELLKLILSNSSSTQRDIASLYDQIETQLRALETLGITSDKCAAMLFPLIESCLPHDLLRVWQRSSMFSNAAGSEKETSTPLETRLKNLMNFLRHEVENEQRINLAAEGFGLTRGMSSMELSGRKESVKGKQFSNPTRFDCPTAAGLMNCDVATCIFCNGKHESEACFKSQKLTMAQKKETLSGKRACFRCLRIGHQADRCRGRMRCVVCSRSHVAIMCPELPSNKIAGKPLEIGRSGTTHEPRHEPKDQALANQTSTHVFLQSLRVNLSGVNGSKVVRALIDTGSQRSYILKDTVMKLGYSLKRQEKIIHCLFGGAEAPNFHCCYDITVSSGDYSYTFEALDQSKICGDVSPIFYGTWTEEARILGIEMSDAKQGGPIELLFGADVVGSLLTGRRRELPCGLIAIETHLGWTLMGKIPTNMGRSNVVTTTLNLFVKDATITDLWDLEAIGIKEPSDRQTKEEVAVAAKEFFLETVTANADGRYVVRLPWIEGHPPLPTNYKLAQKRLVSAVRKLEADHLFEDYSKIFREWEAEGIIEKLDIPEGIDVCQGHYLPHRAVLKEESATTKIRPVFDASAHEKGSPALNHCLEKGPNLIELIPSMLLRFRENKIGVIADIRKAFLQISIHDNDRDFLRFLWLDSNGQEIVLRHKRVVFGLISSPFLLGAVIEYHLSECLSKCSSSEVKYSCNTVERLSRSFYVDNCVTSLPSEDSVNKFIKESISIMAEGRFELRGWERSSSGGSEGDCDPCPVLGLTWDPLKDVLRINKTFFESDLGEDNLVVTKRKILSITQKVFDPIGYLCPAVLLPKLMLQKWWKSELTWDQPVDEATAESFKNWLKDTEYFARIEIPRWIQMGDTKTEHLSIHTFCDASQHAYACVIFLCVTLEGKVSVFLLAAKARVAPIKKTHSKMSIPRLELLAATIGARLYTHVTENLGREIESFFWSDSSTVISWIQRMEEWGVFVWNRVAEIRSLTRVDQWRHLPGIHNPADLPSRGCSPKQLFHLRWWEGPKWLYGPPESWPSADVACDEEEINVERRKKLVTTLMNVNDSRFWNISYFSKYNKTVRMIAWVFRFIHNCKHPDDRRERELNTQEHDVAENFVIKLVQQERFSGVNDERIKGLSPFCDENGIIRLKSRVSSREDSENYRFPVVLPSKHPVVNCLIMEAHIKACHVGTQSLLSLLRERFWILGGRRTVRSVISQCVICKRYESKPLVAEPPPLPLDRVRDAAAFEVTGVDFAGPMYLRNGDKVWICLFTCAVYRAVHLELTTSLSTSSFLQTLRRFVSRRGRPKTIYSDNGTNFLGAENAFSVLNWDIIKRETSVQRIRWHFNPPTASWWGGFWERLIGVLKRLLRKTLGRARLDYEDLLTLVCECDAVVNSRPLTYLSEDPKDLIALSPSMFLRDQLEWGLPDCDAVDRGSLSRKIKKIQKIREDLRVRFRIEYLGQLKLLWEKKIDRPIVMGELVLVGNDNSKRIDWPVGRVVEVLPGKDGQIRLVRVETAKGQLLRPLRRLYPLECCGVPERESKEEDKSGSHEQGEQNPDDDTDSNRECQRSASAAVQKLVTTRLGRVSKIPQRYSAGLGSLKTLDRH